MINRLLYAVVLLTLFVFKCGGEIACGLGKLESEVMGRTRSKSAPVDPNSEEGKRAAQVKRDFESMQRAELAACRCEQGAAIRMTSGCWRVCPRDAPVVADGRQQPP